jgi:hypothetical protein
MLNWLEGAKAAGSTDSDKVLKALQSNPNPEFVFGGGKWWGKELWGRDNVVIGRWPVVVIEGGKTRIKEFASVSDWLDKHSDVLIRRTDQVHEIAWPADCKLASRRQGRGIVALALTIEVQGRLEGSARQNFNSRNIPINCRCSAG